MGYYCITCKAVHKAPTGIVFSTGFHIVQNKKLPAGTCVIGQRIA